MVFTDRRLTGVIDWDTASPGPRSWDLAYLAYRLVPLAHPDNGDAIGSDLGERARRLRVLCDAYGSEQDPAHVLQVAVHRLHDLAVFTEARADQGQENIRGHVGLYRRDARWITAHADQLGRDVA
ncbi:aminoglycoside phosphotransferase family protein [Micromonospora sp. PSH03]|uniref:phosphotransferase n=1 Tax=Micromonospora salmantinae TaxID=2911211 RepID=UPI001EE83B89|nr:phosphotransferase [Micromonospora salmantinae]MCG5455869.1 aminoglycoside phosphotransferase family protein [Micromonospora salmantinae]